MKNTLKNIIVLALAFFIGTLSLSSFAFADNEMTNKKESVAVKMEIKQAPAIPVSAPSVPVPTDDILITPPPFAEIPVSVTASGIKDIPKNDEEDFGKEQDYMVKTYGDEPFLIDTIPGNGKNFFYKVANKSERVCAFSTEGESRMITLKRAGECHVRVYKIKKGGRDLKKNILITVLPKKVTVIKMYHHYTRVKWY